jgi:nucleoside recognition membrane protein YjiH
LTAIAQLGNCRAMRLRRIAAAISAVFFAGVVLLVTIALALGVLLVGIAVMLKEPQGIVAIGTLGICALILWAGFSVAFGKDAGAEEATEPEQTAGSTLDG